MIRKRIGSQRVCISEEARTQQEKEDDVDMIDDDLEEVHTMCEDACADHLTKLSEKAAAVRNRRMDLESSVSDKAVSHEEECTCDICMKSFFRHEDASSWDCPYCGQKYTSEDFEEIDTMSENPYKDVVLTEEQRLERQNHFRKIFDEKRNGIWEDNRKEQMSLELGSDEYNEYVDDLHENHPDAPDDAFHALLEKQNEDMVTKNFDNDADNQAAKKAKSVSGENSVSIQKREEMQKRDIHARAVRDVIAAAALTETLTDDVLARAITTDNPILYDKSVKPDEYAEALKEYVLDEPSL